MSDKELVALHAANLVKDGMVVGLGTGSTANLFIEALARRRNEQGLKVTAASSSVVSTIKAQSLGLPLISIEHFSRLDLYVDGADEVTPDMTLLKGRGSDLVREKLMAKAADQFLVLVDQSKLVSRIGEKFAIPIEVIPFAWQLAKRSLEAIGGRGDLRQNASKDGLAMTSHGSLVLDMTFDAGMSAEQLNAALNATPGVVEHGIFLGLASAVIIATDGKVEERRG
ncbi:MAG: ribose-5-phosphate isomerase RpiA [Methylophilales bacterium]|nr:ribose-5-phosphate isomerase RpiA [Methylophilales bacterium]